MPLMKINLNGRKYVISGLSDDTTSKHILCSLARADSTFHLETTEFSDTSVENDDRTKGSRIRRTRRTRVRQSSTSSLEIVEFDKRCLKGRLTENKLIHLESSEWSEGHATTTSISNEKCSKKFSFKDILKNVKLGHAKLKECDSNLNESQPTPKLCHAMPKECHAISKECNTTQSEGHDKCDCCNAQKCSEYPGKENGVQSNECHATCKGHTTCKSHAICSHAKKITEVKKRKRRTKKRPVSQEVTGWKGKKEENNDKVNELGKKGWRSADDVREPSRTLSSQDEKIRKRAEKHKLRRRKSKHSHDKIDTKSCQDKTLTISSIDNPSEYRQVRRHVRKELGDLRIQRMISRTIDERFVDFHLACMKSYACALPNHHSNEQEIRAKLTQLVESQQKCLSALKKAEKQNKKATSRYTKYLNLDQDKIKFYGMNSSEKPKVERTRKTSETDTGISEMHSDSSTEHTHIYQAYKHDPNIDYVISDDFNPDDVTTEYVRDDVTSQHYLNDVTSERNHEEVTPQVLQDDISFQSYDVKSAGSDVISYDDDITQLPRVPNYVVTVDAVAIDDVTHEVQRYVYEKDDDTQSEIIIAQPTEVVGPETTSALVPFRSAESITMSTLSDISDSSFRGNGDDVEELTRVLLQEQQRQREMRRKLERQSEEIRLMDSRIKEHDKMADILERLKHLNEGLVEKEELDNKEDNDIMQEKKNLEKSKKLSKNLYEYQKSEINKNSISLEQIESQIRRKRWHVESAAKELERVISSSSRSQLDRIRSYEKLPAGFAGLSIRNDVIDETLV